MTAQPAPETRRSRGDRQRDAIVGAVRELLQERSFADLSVSTISERAGVARSAATGPALEELGRFEDCVECGLCLSACPVAGDPRFLGPAALAAAERVLEEPRHADPRAVLGLVDDAHGAWRCHAAFECSAVCPAGVDPGGAIMRLRGRLLRDRLPRLVGRYSQEARA